MSQKDKNGNGFHSDFMRYHGNKMTDKERNAFERDLQKDPFAEEASEGFGEIDPELAEKDISSLRKQLKKRISGKERILWYRIAASIAVLMILSTVFLIVERRKPSEQISYNQVSPVPKEIPVLHDQEQTPEKKEIKEQVSAITDIRIKAPGEVQKSEDKSGQKAKISAKETLPEKKGIIAVNEVEVPENAVMAEKALAPKSVVGYGAKRGNAEQKNEIAGYIPPRPVNGKADFDRYVQDNIRRPDTTTSGQRLVVVLNFIVNIDGKIDSIKVVRSPGPTFSDEAIRLIKEGPAWKPAEENGKVISDDVRVRIVFK